MLMQSWVRTSSVVSGMICLLLLPIIHFIYIKLVTEHGLTHKLAFDKKIFTIQLSLNMEKICKVQTPSYAIFITYLLNFNN